MKAAVLSALALAALGAPALAQPAAVQTYEAPIAGPKGDPIGKIAIRAAANATVVRVTVNAGGLTPGWHGMHFHAVGDCSDPGQFQLSKGHVNHDSSKHGLLNPDGPDDGDVPNIFANADGSANAEVRTDLSLTGDDGLKDADGSALVIHASEDDHATQPIGNAGARVGCAVIK
jgi:Cu-Zn family superoxide dismutase